MKQLINKLAFTIFTVLLVCSGWSQSGLKKGDNVQNLVINKMLNSGTKQDLKQLNDQLTIVDFFGTWCAPCLRALPHLKALQTTYGDQVNIFLVSNETEAQLTKFIKARSGFSFPVIVDGDNSWNNAFQPPSLPYTVVVKNGKVLAVTEAANVTNSAVDHWLKDTDIAASANTSKTQTNTTPASMDTRKQSSNPLVQISQDYIYAAKTGASLSSLSQQLKTISYEDLKTKLSTDDTKKAFWINLYNGYTQATLSAAPDLYKDRNAFFKKKAINVSGEMFSLDDIEHGILRHSKIKWSMGHLNKLFPSRIEKDLRVDTLDWRIHFALNCGAKSCPPIAFYNNEVLDAQLDLATKVYLGGEATYDSIKNVVEVPKLMSWFRADFGGKKGMRKILADQNIIPLTASPKITFKDYDWDLYLNNYEQ